MSIYEKLLMVLEHVELTNKEFMDGDDEIVPGVTLDDLDELRVIANIEINKK